MKGPCFQGPRGRVGVCVWDLLLELSSASRLPPLPALPSPPSPARFLSFPSLGSEGGGLSCHSYSSQGIITGHG